MAQGVDGLRGRAGDATAPQLRVAVGLAQLLRSIVQGNSELHTVMLAAGNGNGGAAADGGGGAMWGALQARLEELVLAAMNVWAGVTMAAAELRVRPRRKAGFLGLKHRKAFFLL